MNDPIRAGSTSLADPSGRSGALAALAAVTVMLVAMDAAMLAGVAPHPPGERGPYLAAATGLCCAAIVLFAARSRAAAWVGIGAALALLPVMGPTKLFTEPNAGLLSPVIAAGTGAIVALLWSSVRWLRSSGAGPSR